MTPDPSDAQASSLGRAPHAGPVFITGSPRSGTSIFTLALRTVTGLPGHNEGLLFNLIGPVGQQVERHFKGQATADPRHTVAHVDPEQVKRAFAVALLELADKVHGGPAWFDKTGGTAMFDFVRLCIGARPFATFFLFRRPIENVVSRLQKFPQIDLASHARDWVAVMQAWRRLRPELPEGSWLEVEQGDMVERPEEVAAGVGRVLGLPGEKVQAMAEVFRKRRPQQLASATIGRRLSLDDTGWSEEERRLFLDIVGEEMALWGFRLDDRYRVVG